MGDVSFVALREMLLAQAGGRGFVRLSRPWYVAVGRNRDAALLIDELLFRADQPNGTNGVLRANGLFAVGDADLAEKLCVGRKAVAAARAHLAEGGWLTWRRSGAPPRIWYDLDADVVTELFVAKMSIVPSGTINSAPTPNQLRPHAQSSSFFKKELQKEEEEEEEEAAAVAAAAVASAPATTPKRRPKPETTSKRFRAVMEAILKVRRLPWELAAEGTEKVHARSLTATIVNMKGGAHVDAELVLQWGREWYADVAAKTGKPQRQVSPPTYDQLRKWFGRRWEEEAGSAIGDEERRRAPEWATSTGTPLPLPQSPAQDPADVAAGDAWSSVLNQLRLSMTKQTFDAWLRDTAGVELDDERLVVRVPNEATKDWLTTRLGSAVQETAQRLLGRDVELKVA